jgi:ribonucleotide reductase class II
MDNNNPKGFSFPESAPTANPVFYRTYSRRIDGRRETPEEVFDRTTRGLTELGKLTEEESSLILQMQNEMKALPSGRWLWVGGTEWIKKPENYYGSYNCSSTKIVDWKAFGLMMNLAMQGCGTGAMLEERFISQLPEIVNHLQLDVVGEYGQVPKGSRINETELIWDEDTLTIVVGDSREGWVKAYQSVLELSSNTELGGNVVVTIDVSHVRPEGSRA